MIIESVRVSNFRSILDETLHCDMLTALVGRNGSGKSSFLRALSLFYGQSKVDEEDYYNRDTSKDIVVAVTYKVVSDGAKAQFESYIQGERLTVDALCAWSGGKPTITLHGSSLQNQDFKAVREAGGAKDQKPQYEKIRESYSLPKWANQANALDTMTGWEAAHPEQCERHRDDGKFFGFSGVGKGYLGKYTRFLFVPAVREASDDAQEGKGSILSVLMDLVVRSVIAKKEAYTQLQKETQARYEEIMTPGNLPELQGLGSSITKTLQSFVPDASLLLDWRALAEVSIPMPQADAKLVEDGFKAHVARTGHGLQRAFVVTMLQHLTLAQMTPDESDSNDEGGNKADGELPNFVLAIEEPELYQHPSRQRHFAEVLDKLASGTIPGVAEQTQVVYATHSPLFVGIDRIGQIRVLRKAANGALPRVTSVVFSSLDALAEEVRRANGAGDAKYSGQTLRPRLKAIMTPWMNEGFFADVAVLVEGEDDRAAILGSAAAAGLNFDSSGISVIPCGGKTCIDRPAIIFRALGIPVYAIWDGDEDAKDAKPEDNRRLLRVFDEKEEDWPDFVGRHCACFRLNLEQKLAEEMGKEYFEDQLQKQQNANGIPKRKHAIKNPVVIENILAQGTRDGKPSPTLKAILKRILALRQDADEKETPPKISDSEHQGVV